MELRRIAIGTVPGQFVRGLDATLDHYVDLGDPIEVEVSRVIKSVVLMLATHHFGDDELVLLQDSSQLNIPREISESSAFEVRKILNPKPDRYAPPGDPEPEFSIAMEEIENSPDLSDSDVIESDPWAG